MNWVIVGTTAPHNDAVPHGLPPALQSVPEEIDAPASIADTAPAWWI